MKTFKNSKQDVSNAWQKVQLSRHPARPYSLDYIQAWSEHQFIELHGDRNFADDKALIGGLIKVDGKTWMVIGQQKGRNTQERKFRNFGMPNPEGYRKANRLMHLAEKFQIPIVTLIDTPGAYPGLSAEERGQGQAIAQNLYDMAGLKVPIIAVVIGEGASGGALGIGVADRILMLENTWYSVISPESCSSILFRSWDYKERAAELLKLTAADMLANHLIHEIVSEPQEGAHANPTFMFTHLKQILQKHFLTLSQIPVEELVEQRIEQFTKMGSFKECL